MDARTSRVESGRGLYESVAKSSRWINRRKKEGKERKEALIRAIQKTSKSIEYASNDIIQKLRLSIASCARIDARFHGTQELAAM